MQWDIGEAVGYRGVNRVEDVATVQAMLNIVPAHMGGPMRMLEVDGQIGPQTMGAILRFQSTLFRAPDGVIWPLQRGGISLFYLNMIEAVALYLAQPIVGFPTRPSPPLRNQSNTSVRSAIGGLLERDAPLPSPSQVPFFSRQSDYTCTIGGSVDVLAEFVAVSGGYLEATRRSDRQVWKMPFATVGGGIGWQPAKVGRLFEKILKLPPGTLVGLMASLASSNPLVKMSVDLALKYGTKIGLAKMALGLALKYLNISASFLAPSTNIGEVYIADSYNTQSRDLSFSDFVGGCVIVSAGAGAIIGYSGIMLLLGIEPNHPENAALNPKAIAFARGFNYGLSVGASITLTGGYASQPWT